VVFSGIDYISFRVPMSSVIKHKAFRNYYPRPVSANHGGVAAELGSGKPKKMLIKLIGINKEILFRSGRKSA
jgi:hypothetical protein